MEQRHERLELQVSEVRKVAPTRAGIAQTNETHGVKARDEQSGVKVMEKKELLPSGRSNDPTGSSGTKP